MLLTFYKIHITHIHSHITCVLFVYERAGMSFSLLFFIGKMQIYVQFISFFLMIPVPFISGCFSSDAPSQLNIFDHQSYPAPIMDSQQIGSFENPYQVSFGGLSECFHCCFLKNDTIHQKQKSVSHPVSNSVSNSIILHIKNLYLKPNIHPKFL